MSDEAVDAHQAEIARLRSGVDHLHIRLTSLEGVLRNMSARLAALEYPAQQPYVTNCSPLVRNGPPLDL